VDSNDYNKALGECTKLFVNKTKSLSDFFKARNATVAHKFSKNHHHGLGFIKEY